MAAHMGHMDVVTHHKTVSGGFAMTRSQWRTRGVDANGRPVEVHHHDLDRVELRTSLLSTAPDR